MKYTYKIGNFCFTLELPEEVAVPPHFEIFRQNINKIDEEKVKDNEQCPVFSYHMALVDILPEPKGKLYYQGKDIDVYRNGNLESRQIGIRGMDDFYALYEETDLNSVQIYYSRKHMDLLIVDPVFVSLFALERRMITFGGLVLHCAYMENRNEAILFSAPSETGKTTQANLWGQYRGSVTINGDRGLLSKEGDTWMVHGWPVCGSSDVCNNKDMPIRSIVMLRQAPDNQVRRLTEAEAFRLIYSQITINRWDKELAVYAIDLIEKLVSEVPVYELGCTISEEAVDVLEKALYPDERK